MATTTPNFGWPVPTSTDLVKDGATAIEALGDAIDASLVDLEGGTTGQILSKASNTDMDFTWITNDVGDITAVTAGTGISGGGTSGAVTITNSMATTMTTKGDLVPATGSGTFARLAAGANDLVLSAASGEATGLKYAGAWTSYTPSWTNLTVGNGTVNAKYCQIGKIIMVSVTLVFGSTTAITGGFVQLTVPTGVVQGRTVGNLYMQDAGIAEYTGIVKQDATTVVALNPGVSSGTYSGIANMSATVPFTWGTNDIMEISISYQAA